MPYFYISAIYFEVLRIINVHATIHNRRMNTNTCASRKIEPNVVKFENLDSDIQEILQAAVDARQLAYCPYSKFQVGAALRCQDGTIYKGCNIENASFTVGTCAERAAFAKAISEGNMKFKAIAVIGYQEASFTTPCGACRQFMREFGSLDVYVSKPALESVLVTNMEELLPFAFVDFAV